MAEIAESLGTAHDIQSCIDPDDDMRNVIFHPETGMPLPPPPPAGVAPGAVVSDLTTPAHVTNPETAKRGGQKRPREKQYPKGSTTEQQATFVMTALKSKLAANSLNPQGTRYSSSLA